MVGINEHWLSQEVNAQVKKKMRMNKWNETNEWEWNEKKKSKFKKKARRVKGNEIMRKAEKF